MGPGVSAPGPVKMNCAIACDRVPSPGPVISFRPTLCAGGASAAGDDAGSNVAIRRADNATHPASHAGGFNHAVTQRRQAPTTPHASARSTGNPTCRGRDSHCPIGLPPVQAASEPGASNCAGPATQPRDHDHLPFLLVKIIAKRRNTGARWLAGALPDRSDGQPPQPPDIATPHTPPPHHTHGTRNAWTDLRSRAETGSPAD